MTASKFGWRAQQARYALFAIGMICLYFAIKELPILWTTKSQLNRQKGTLHSAHTYVMPVSTTNKGYTSTSQKAELIFYLNGHTQKYYLAENIGDDLQDKKYESMLDRLEMADTISVWVKKNEMEYLQPKVFQIDIDNSTLLDLNETKYEHRTMAIILSFLGIGLIVFFFWATNPTKIRKAIGLPD